MNRFIFIVILLLVGAPVFASCVAEGEVDPMPTLPCNSDSGSSSTTESSSSSDGVSFFSGWWATVERIITRVKNFIGGLIAQIWYFFSVWIPLSMAEVGGLLLVSFLKSIPLPEWADISSVSTFMDCKFRYLAYIFALDKAFLILPSAFTYRMLFRAVMGSRA